MSLKISLSNVPLGERGVRGEPAGELKEKSGKKGLLIKRPPFGVLVRCQLPGAAFLQESVFEHKPVPVEGGHDSGCGLSHCILYDRQPFFQVKH